MAGERMFMSFVMRLEDKISTIQGKSSALDLSPADFSVDLNNGSSPVIDTTYAAVLALAAGTATIDLTALAWNDTSLTDVDMTGKKPYGYYIQPLGANSITIIEAVTNGHTMFPATNGLLVGGGGNSRVMAYNEGGFATVSSTVKDLTVTGTGTETFLFAIAAGV